MENHGWVFNEDQLNTDYKSFSIPNTYSITHTTITCTVTNLLTVHVTLRIWLTLSLPPPPGSPTEGLVTEDLPAAGPATEASTAKGSTTGVSAVEGSGNSVEGSTPELPKG